MTISYLHESQRAEAERARVIVTGLFAAYQEKPELMAEHWHDGVSDREPERSRYICDYIAGMTDRYAERQHELIHGKLPPA
jgi:dGTPase